MSLDRKGCVVAPRKHNLPLNRHESDIRGSGLKSYLFSVELRQGVAIVTPAWPERRRRDAESLQGVAELIAAPVSAEQFRAASRPILNMGKRHDPECRHFVVLNNTIESRREADQARWMVEEFFYKREARR